MPSPEDKAYRAGEQAAWVTAIREDIAEVKELLQTHTKEINSRVHKLETWRSIVLGLWAASSYFLSGGFKH